MPRRQTRQKRPETCSQRWRKTVPLVGVDVAAAASLALAVSAFSITVTRAKVMEPLRKKTKGKVRDLLHCPYCISHWASFFALAFVNVPVISSSRVFDYAVFAFSIVGLSALIT